MRLNSLNIKNYRCFEDFDIKFNDKLTVIVGNNGSGKSAVLDAARIAIGSFLLGIDGQSATGIEADDVRHIAYEVGSTFDLQPQYPASVNASGWFVGEGAVYWSRALNKTTGRTTTAETKKITDISCKFQNDIRNGDRKTVLPLISYYGTGRLWAQKRQKKDINFVKNFTRFSGYIDCLDNMSNEKLMLKWFEKMTLIELQKQQLKSDFTLPELDAVKRAIGKFFYRMTGQRDIKATYNLESRGLEINFKDDKGESQRVPVNELSDGYRDTLSMVADIAYRMAILNPQLLENVLDQTSGVVLIDEVDLHLHPTWQQHILQDLTEIFPCVQFIVTTHAPSVINSVKKDHLIILEGYKAHYPKITTYGRDVNSILSTIMGADVRPKVIQETFREFYEKLSEGLFDDASRIINELQTIIGDSDPELEGAKVSLELESLEG